MAIFFLFLALQIFDAGTTLIFLGRGVSEGNPLIRALLDTSAHPAFALALVKAAACALAWAAPPHCAPAPRERVLCAVRGLECRGDLERLAFSYQPSAISRQLSARNPHRRAVVLAES